MNVTGIIAEYDPFHNGHLYHINRARELTEADFIAVVMSGPFMQRGAPAFFDKRLRAAMAVEGGADLVVELPYIYACNSGQEFARGGVNILNGLCADNIAFGCETADLDLLKRAALAAADSEGRASDSIRSLLDSGLSYPEAVTRSAGMIYGSDVEAVLRQPNNLLAVEYIKNIEMSGLSMRPVPIKRSQARHDGRRGLRRESRPEGKAEAPLTASASFIRNTIKERGINAAVPYLPESTACILPDKAGLPDSHSMENMFDFLKYKIIATSADRLNDIYSVDEGIENRLRGMIADCEDLSDFALRVKSRRYTLAKINRMLVHILMDLTKEDFRLLSGTYYARVLGFSERGRQFLRLAGKRESMPILSNLNGMDRLDGKVRKCLEYDLRAADVYSMICGHGRTGMEKKCVPYWKRNDLSEALSEKY